MLTKSQEPPNWVVKRVGLLCHEVVRLQGVTGKYPSIRGWSGTVRVQGSGFQPVWALSVQTAPAHMKLPRSP